MTGANALGPKIKDNADGTICVAYEPTVEGKHEVLMSYAGQSVEGSPFSCSVDKIDGSFVTCFGSGLVGGLSGQGETFTVVAKAGTAKDIVVKMDGPARVDLKRADHSDGSANFSYCPLTPGVYNINVHYHGKPIKGSPFAAKISGEGRKRSTLSVGNSAEYTLKVLEADIVDLVGTMTTPGGHIEPIILRKSEDGELAIASFQPRVKGDYKVNVMKFEKPIKNSPFRVVVGDKELGHAGGVHLSGATAEAKANFGNEIVVDTSNGGYGALSISIEGPHRSDISTFKVEPHKYTIHYSPHEPGIYILNVCFADEHCPGSPYLLNVGGNPSGRVRETVAKEMAQAEPVAPGTPTKFVLKIPGTNPFDMEACITNPDGVSELCEVMDLDDFHYDIKMTPAMSGLHILSIKHKTLHISGSPFQYSVGQLNQGGPHKVQVGGPGLEKGEVGIQNVFNIYTREAGPGNLTVSVEGPSKSVIDIEERPNGFLGAQYKVEKPGIYGVHLKYNDHHIPGSPYIVNVAPDCGVARSVTVHSLRDKGLVIDKPLTFSVNFNGVSGHLHCTLRSPSGEHKDCFTEEMDRGVYGVRFIPKENGVHYVDVKFNDAHIPDSPFAIMVGSSASDPAMVTANGEGLEHGKCGIKNKFSVRTAGAGTGLLAVFVDGPSKCALSCKELDDGYEFSYTPFCPGNYLITIKYGNISIAGSPYQTHVTGQTDGTGAYGPDGVGRKASPITEQSSMCVEAVEKKAGAGGRSRKLRGDASKVVISGTGLKKAFTNRMMSINVNVKDAGLALLTAGMLAPSGLPAADLHIVRKTAAAYEVRYKVGEQGEHILHIQWGNEEIPGSPFCIST